MRPDVGDVAAIRLADGRIRIIGNRRVDPVTNIREYYSDISADGIHFVQEPGVRLTGSGIHAGCTVLMPDGSFRMYYTDQSRGSIVNTAAAVPSGAPARPAA